jgi:FkbM family methyltransferase
MIEKNSVLESNTWIAWLLLGYFIKSTPWFRGKNRLIQYWMKRRDKKTNKIRKIGGYQIISDLSIDYEAMVWLEQEERVELNILRRLLKKNQVFVDCGANIGLWTITAASVLGPSGKLWAFEPNKFTFEKLKRNISSGKYIDRIQLFCAAVGSQNKNIPFRIIQEEHNICHITDTLDSESITVPVITLDSILQDEPVDGIKIDVEGFEFEVLKGSLNILKKNQPWIFIEFNTWITKVNVLQLWDVHQLLCGLGYVCCQRCSETITR